MTAPTRPPLPRQGNSDVHSAGRCAMSTIKLVKAGLASNSEKSCKPAAGAARKASKLISRLVRFAASASAAQGVPGPQAAERFARPVRAEWAGSRAKRLGDVLAPQSAGPQRGPLPRGKEAFVRGGILFQPLRQIAAQVSVSMSIKSREAVKARVIAGSCVVFWASFEVMLRSGADRCGGRCSDRSVWCCTSRAYPVGGASRSIPSCNGRRTRGFCSRPPAISWRVGKNSSL